MFILGIDTETTGLDSSAKIVELSAILVDSKTFKTVQSYSTLINPQIPIPPKATDIHGITDEDVASAPTFEEVLARSPFLNWLDRVEVVFGHNVQFDVKQLGQDLFVNKSQLDTLKLVRAEFLDWHNHKLQTCVTKLQLTSRKAHSALDDVESSREILEYFAKTHSLDLRGLFNYPHQKREMLKEKLLEL